MMFRHVSHVFLFLFSGLCSTAVNAQDQIIPRPVSVKVEAKGAATPVKLDEGMRIICKEKDGEFRCQAHLLQSRMMASHRETSCFRLRLASSASWVRVSIS